MLKNKYHLKFKIFVYIILFILFILLFIWLFQIIFLSKNYEKYKTNELIDSVKEAKQLYQNKESNIYEYLESMAEGKGICTEIVEDNQVSYTTNQLIKGCYTIYKRANNTFDDELKFIASSDEEFIKTIERPYDNEEILVYGLKLDKQASIFSYSNIQPIDATVTILKRHLIIITILTVIISSIIAYFMANMLSKPIISLTKKSKELSKGNFKVDFNVNTDIIELDDLSKTLNYTKDTLKNSDDILRDLMANVSHDLKTPLTMIKAYAEMIRDLTFNNAKKRDNNLNIIIDEVDRLNLLVNDILSLSKLENNIEKLEAVEFDLVSLIETIITRFKIFSLTQDYQFMFYAPKKLIIKADKQKLEQVIYNLISNAINYSENSKKIYITVLPRKKIRVNIADTGPGIKKEDINKIWDKYYKAEKKHKRSMVGSGLGLSIVKNILELHSYKYGVISKKNKGTTFFFEIK